MVEKIKLTDEYDKIFKLIQEKENFTLLRYGDGERSIMLGHAVKAQEGWEAPEGGSDLGRALKGTLLFEDSNVYYGISCPCCDRSAYYWYMTNIKNKNITFANLFVNYNYRRFKNDFEKITRDAVVIGNHKGKSNKIGSLNVLRYYSVGDNCVEFWQEEAQELIAQVINDYGKRDNLLYVVSAGPLAEVIISELYKNNPNNCYIDFGSALDYYIHQKDSRPYTNEDTIFANRNCWMHNPEKANFDVSVVLTTFKKPDALEKQLLALKNQTLKPKEIFLFQDGIQEKYKINFDEKLLKQFDDIKISEVNVGVWERFRYAKSACSEYICLFDDDTIPGSKWLENCHYHMMEEEGIYGTVGIVLQKPEQYPYSGFYRVGWHRPCSKLAEVDFVGHSWFFKKEYLEYMFDNTEEYQQYKYAAEDMCLSFQCKKHGINTFVPPHPYWDMELWGSKPEYGLKFGRASTAISQNGANCINMRNALKLFMDNGWKLVAKEKRKNIKQTNTIIKIEYYKELVKKVLKKLRIKG